MTTMMGITLTLFPTMSNLKLNPMHCQRLNKISKFANGIVCENKFHPVANKVETQFWYYFGLLWQKRTHHFSKPASKLTSFICCERP